MSDTDANPLSKTKIWTELKQDLKIPAQTTPAHTSTLPVPSDALELEKQILKVWRHHENSESKLAPLLYEFCKKLNAQGKKGAGFQAWLKQHKKPRSTAYRWINSYAKKESLPSPFPPKAPKKVDKKITLSHMGQGSTSIASVDDAIAVMDKFLNQLTAEKRLSCATELNSWLKAYIAGLEGTEQ